MYPGDKHVDRCIINNLTDFHLLDGTRNTLLSQTALRYSEYSSVGLTSERDENTGSKRVNVVSSYRADVKLWHLTDSKDTKHCDCRIYDLHQCLSSAPVMALLHCSIVYMVYWKFDLQSGNNIAVINCAVWNETNVTQCTQNAFSWWPVENEQMVKGRTPERGRAVTEHQINSSSVYSTQTTNLMYETHIRRWCSGMHLEIPLKLVDFLPTR